VERPVALLCNPSAGGGRAARILPRAEAALRGFGVDFDTAVTRDLDHARELARNAAQAGEVTVTLSGDGLIGATPATIRVVPRALRVLVPA